MPRAALLALFTFGCVGKTPPVPPAAPTRPPEVELPAPPAPPQVVLAAPAPRAPTLRWNTLSNPCGSKGVPYGLYFRDRKQGWVGCGDGAGLFATTDGGATFTRAHPSDNLYVFHILDDAQGRLLVCGHDYEPVQGDVLLYRQDPTGWTPLLWFTNKPSDRGGVVMSNCGRVAPMADGTIVVASNTIGDISYTKDDGKTWTKAERYWEEANLVPKGYGAHQLMELQAIDGRLYGSGSTMHEPPLLYTPSHAPNAQFFNMKKHVADSGTMGEAWSMGSPDGGKTWVIGGRDERLSRQASGFLFRTTDQGETWAPATVDTAIDSVLDIAFSADGKLGVAVGHRYPPASRGGFVLISEDGGATWKSQDVQVAPLQSVVVVGQEFWVAGDNYLGHGEWR